MSESTRYAVVTKRVQLMLRAYPYPPRDPMYATIACRALERFSDALVVAATDPVHGAPRQHKDYPPSAGQLTRWCEDHMPRAMRADRDTPRITDRQARPTREQIEAILGRKVSWFDPARVRDLPAAATLDTPSDGRDFSRITAP
jgi:hypothetical protein